MKNIEKNIQKLIFGDIPAFGQSGCPSSPNSTAGRQTNYHTPIKKNWINTKMKILIIINQNTILVIVTILKIV